jgi:hypothetical protein
MGTTTVGGRPAPRTPQEVLQCLHNFDVLGLPVGACSDEEVRSAYRSLALTLDPVEIYRQMCYEFFNNIPLLSRG